MVCKRSYLLLAIRRAIACEMVCLLPVVRLPEETGAVAGPAAGGKVTDTKIIDALVEHFVANRSVFTRLMNGLVTLFTDNEQLPRLIHSIKGRVKDPSSLRDKLGRKLAKCREANAEFGITRENLFEKINDLAGVRLLHLHTSQIKEIDECVRSLLDQEMYTIIEGPFARTWDDEYREFFKRVGMTTEASQSLYTSVHYVVQPTRKSASTAEIQVRTLAEELWGEVDHAINYPHKTASVACQEELKVLARITSSCTRLVDAIFISLGEHDKLSTPANALPHEMPRSL